jgi:hypothetical protein
LKKKVVVAVVLLSALLVGGFFDGHRRPNQAQAVASFDCYGAPDDYVAAFDSVDGVTDGKVSYPEARVFLEAQGHVAPAGVTSRHHMEHIHIGTCFPYAEVVKQAQTARTFDVRYVFHNVSNYTITKSTTNWVSQGGSGHGHQANAAQLAELQAAMDASSDGSTHTVFQSYTETSTFGTNCRKTVKFALEVIASNANAVVNRWETGGQFTTYIDYPENASACTPEFTRDTIRGRDWVPDPNMGYIYASAFPVPASQMSEPVPTPTWDVDMAASGMAGEVDVDPNYHMHDPNAPDGDDHGIWYDDKGQQGVESFTETIPTGDFPPGLHRLVYIGDRHPTDIGHSSLIVMPFTVANPLCP